LSTGRSEPDTPYGRSKALGEAAVSAWAAADPSREVVILRPSPVYGPGNQANLAAFVRQVVAGRPCLIGRGDTRKSVVSLDNVAAAIEFAAEHAAPGCELFNVSDRETLSLRQLADTAAELAHAPPPRGINAALAACVAPIGDLLTAMSGREFPLTTTRLRALRETSVFPCDKLVAAGFRHPQTTRQGLAELIEWMSAARPSQP
jgi:nucleoside-diphosphate-sugar epimerase